MASRYVAGYPTLEQIINVIHTVPGGLERAMDVLYTRQTLDERRDHDTKHNNSRGVQKCWGNKIVYYARWIREGRTLTGRHRDTALRIAKIHSRQLLGAAWQRWWVRNTPEVGTIVLLARGFRFGGLDCNETLVSKRYPLMVLGTERLADNGSGAIIAIRLADCVKGQEFTINDAHSLDVFFRSIDKVALKEEVMC